jgi:hypothetical protein
MGRGFYRDLSLPADMESVFMTSNNPELVGGSDSNYFLENVISPADEARIEPPKMKRFESSHVEQSDEGRTAVSSSSNPAPSILIDKYEEEESNPNPALGTAETDYRSDMNSSDQFGLTNNFAEIKHNSDQDVYTESEVTHHHSRLLRLLSGDLGGVESVSGGEAGALSAPTSTPSASETEATVLPPNLPGVRLRIRSLRAKDRIPSRVFRSLQHEFDSSTEDITQAVISSPPPLSPNQISQMTSGFIGYSGFFRYSRLYASVTPETPSSATSELEGFFSHHQNLLH